MFTRLTRVTWTRSDVPDRAAQLKHQTVCKKRFSCFPSIASHFLNPSGYSFYLKSKIILCGIFSHAGTAQVRRWHRKGVTIFAATNLSWIQSSEFILTDDLFVFSHQQSFLLPFFKGVCQIKTHTKRLWASLKLTGSSLKYLNAGRIFNVRLME